ncbi:MAG: hypothetical protein KAQ67_04240 [Gammaproteobacteria bacterium]|nr:hypothetical protein [Gammaproteobacteria bacterium]
MSEFKTSSECIELICQQGCTVVRDVIVSLEQHNKVAELDHLDDKQKQLILVELKTVMSVYDQTDDQTGEL